MYHMKGEGKAHKVMGEFKRGTLRSGSKKGPKVTDRDQAVAIAMSEAGMSRKKKEYKSHGSPYKIGIGPHVQHIC